MLPLRNNLASCDKQEWGLRRCRCDGVVEKELCQLYGCTNSISLKPKDNNCIPFTVADLRTLSPPSLDFFFCSQNSDFSLCSIHHRTQGRKGDEPVNFRNSLTQESIDTTAPASVSVPKFIHTKAGVFTACMECHYGFPKRLPMGEHCSRFFYFATSLSALSAPTNCAFLVSTEFAMECP